MAQLTDEQIIEALDQLQEMIGQDNEARGFHEQGNRLRDALAIAEEEGAPASDIEVLKDALRNYEIAKIALSMGEGAEAIEELRTGYPIDEVYYSGANTSPYNPEEPLNTDGTLRKPEGAGVEIGDSVVRSLDLAAESGFSLGRLIMQKLEYNRTRGFRHGGKTV